MYQLCKRYGDPITCAHYSVAWGGSPWQCDSPQSRFLMTGSLAAARDRVSQASLGQQQKTRPNMRGLMRRPTGAGCSAGWEVLCAVQRGYRWLAAECGQCALRRV